MYLTTLCGQKARHRRHFFRCLLVVFSPAAGENFLGSKNSRYVKKQKKNAEVRAPGVVAGLLAGLLRLLDNPVALRG